MEAEVILRVITRSAHDFVDLAVLAARHLHTSADCRAIRACADALDHDPIVFISAIIAQQSGRAVEIIHDHINVSVIVEVSEGAAASKVFGAERGPYFCGDILEPSGAEVAI